MKTMKHIITVIAILFSVQLFAASDIDIRTNGNAEIIIEANNITGEERIRIFDENGTLLFFEAIHEHDYLKTFTLSTLPVGKYFVEYENDNRINTAVVVKEKNNTLVTSNFNRVSFKPMINQKGNFLNVGMTNPKLKEVSISIIDPKGYELTEVENLNTLFVNKTFDTKRLPKGDYSVQVNCGTHSFTKLISIK